MSKTNNSLDPQNKLQLFQNQKVRTHWDEKEEQWYFSIVDVVGVLSESVNPNNYWKVLKSRLKKEGSQLVTDCNQLKMQSSDGKFYKTDVADTAQVLRLIQSIPSKKAEPFKLWLAQVGKERLDEIENPELAQERMKEIYEQKGYPKDWIDKRLRGIAIRQNLTDEWKERGIKEHRDYAILTAEISKATSCSMPTSKSVILPNPGTSWSSMSDDGTSASAMVTSLAACNSSLIVCPICCV